jgi:gluconolactonase
MRYLIALLFCLCAMPVLCAADDLKPTGDAKIVDADTKLEHLFTRTAKIAGGLTEGPAVAPDGSIYFSDIPFGKDKGMILRFDPKTKKTTAFTEDSHKSNGLKFDAKGFLIACEGSDYGGRCLSRWDVKTGKRDVLVDNYKLKRFNAPNDLAIDLKGRIYFTDPRYLGPEPRELEHRAVYRVDKDGSGLVEVTHDCEKPNGIAISPDQKTLYVVDHNNGTDTIDPKAPAPKKGAMKLYTFPLGADGLVNGPRKTIIDFGEEDGIDGMCVDVMGNLYMAVRSSKRPGVWVADPSGKELAYIPTGSSQAGVKEPKGIPANVTFGLGDESKVLYVTVDQSLYRIRLKIDGWHIPFEK